MLSVEHLQFLHRLSCLAAIIVILLGGLVLIGWAVHLPVIYSVAEGLPEMAPPTALSFIFTGAALLLLQPEHTIPFRRAVGQVLALGGLLIGILLALSHVSAMAANLFGQFSVFMGLYDLSPKASSFPTALAFVLTNMGLLLLSFERELLVNIAQWMAFSSVMALVVVFFGYAHNESIFYMFSDGLGIALHTATGFALLGWGVILARVEKGFFRIMASNRAGGLVARRVMLLMGLFPPMLGWLPVLLHSDYFTHTRVESLLAAVMVVGIVIIVIRLGYQLDDQEKLRENAEDTIRQHQTDLAHMVRLNTMGEMASGIAHELNQPLTAIANYASASQRFIQSEGCDAKRLQEPLENIRKQAVRASEIIRRLREFVRKQQPNKTNADLYELIHEGLVLIRGEAARQQVPILLELDDHMPDVSADKIQIEQVILNIVQNAIDAVSTTDSHRRMVTIRSYQAEDKIARVDVVDTGPGMDEELRRRVFDAFVTTKGAKGMGIGLSLCRSIVESHGGRLWVESEPGQGSTFSFTLPLAKEPASCIS